MSLPGILNRRNTMGFCRGWYLDALNTSESSELQKALKLMAKMLILTDIAIKTSMRANDDDEREKTGASSSFSVENIPRVDDVFAAVWSDRGERFLSITFCSHDKDDQGKEREEKKYNYNINPESGVEPARNIAQCSFAEIERFLADHEVEFITFGESGEEEFSIWHTAPMGQRYIKTRHAPYDGLITACLTILYHFLPHKLHLRSDSDFATDYYSGVQLASLLLNIDFKNPCKSLDGIYFALPHPIFPENVMPAKTDAKSFLEHLIVFMRGTAIDLERLGYMSADEKTKVLDIVDPGPVSPCFCTPVEFSRNIAIILKIMGIISWDLQFYPHPNPIVERALKAFIQFPQDMAHLLKNMEIAPVDFLSLTKYHSTSYLLVGLINSCCEWLRIHGFLSRDAIRFIDRANFDCPWVDSHKKFFQSAKQLLQDCLPAFSSDLSPELSPGTFSNAETVEKTSQQEAAVCSRLIVGRGGSDSPLSDSAKRAKRALSDDTGDTTGVAEEEKKRRKTNAARITS